MTSQEMFKHPQLPRGKCFSNVAPLGEKPDWQIIDTPHHVSINEPQLLFGYDTEVFLRKQYK